MNESNGATDPQQPAVDDPEITVYWRPGCGFCGSLIRQLEHHDIAHQLVNIWDDESAAATVRSIARGNETVPTVVVGNVGLVNPSLQQIVQAVQAVHAAEALQGVQANGAHTQPVG